MNPFNDGLPYELPPLSDYVVTERKPAPPELPKMDLGEWLDQDRVGRVYTTNTSDLTIHIHQKKPTDVEVVLNTFDILRGWKIIWED